MCVVVFDDAGRGQTLGRHWQTGQHHQYHLHGRPLRAILSDAVFGIERGARNSHQASEEKLMFAVYLRMILICTSPSECISSLCISATLNRS